MCVGIEILHGVFDIVVFGLVIRVWVDFSEATIGEIFWCPPSEARQAQFFEFTTIGEVFSLLPCGIIFIL